MEAWVVGISAFIGSVVGVFLTRDAIIDVVVVRRGKLNGTSEALVTSRLIREVSALLVCLQFLAADIVAFAYPNLRASLVIWLLVFIPIQVTVTGLITYGIKRRLLRKFNGDRAQSNN